MPDEFMDAVDDLLSTLDRILEREGAHYDLREAIGVNDLDELKRRKERVKEALLGGGYEDDEG